MPTLHEGQTLIVAYAEEEAQQRPPSSALGAFRWEKRPHGRSHQYFLMVEMDGGEAEVASFSEIELKEVNPTYRAVYRSRIRAGLRNPRIRVRESVILLPACPLPMPQPLGGRAMASVAEL